jgi:hypothetical protein
LKSAILNILWDAGFAINLIRKKNIIYDSILDSAKELPVFISLWERLFNWNVGRMEYWNIGILECWSDGAME